MSSQFGQAKPQPQINPYSSIPGYRTDEPANSAWNRTILAYKSAGVPYTIEKQAPGQAPSKQPLEDRQGLGSVTVSQNVLNKSDALRASMGLPPLENATNVFVTTGPRTTSTNPELEASILGTFEKEPTALKYTGTDKGSYLNALYAKGVLTDLDFEKLNTIVKDYNAKISKENITARQQNIAARHQQLMDVTSTLQEAKSAGATSIDIFNAKKEKIGTVNPQNIPQARLQFLQLTRKETSPVNLSFNQTSKTVTTGVETKLTTPTYKEDPLSLFARGYLGTVTEFGVSFIGQLASDIKAGKITNVSPLEAMLSGKSLVAPDVQSKLAKVDTTFGLSEQIGKTITPKQYSVTQEIASLAGIGTGVTVLTVAGMGGKGKPVSTIAKANPESFESHVIKITNAFQEKPLTVQTEKIGATRELFQGTEGIPLKQSSYKTKPFEYLRPISTQPIIKTGKIPLEKTTAPVPSLAKEIIGIGKIGEKGAVVYHGTSEEHAMQILKTGFQGAVLRNPSKVTGSAYEFTNPKEVTAFASPLKSIAENYALERSNLQSKPALLKITLKPQTRILNIKDIPNEMLGKTFPNKNEIGSNEVQYYKSVINYAKKNKYDVLQSGTLGGKGNYEIAILNKNAISNIEKITTNISKENKPTFESISKEASKLEAIKGEPLFGKIKTGEFVVPLGKSGTASGEPNLFAAYVSEKQVAFVRQPSKLPENEFIISGKINPAVKSTLGLKEVSGMPDVYLGKTTPGTREYLKQAINANLVSGKQAEIHVQSLEDILTSPKAYTEVSRNPDLLSGGKFPGIVRPKVIGYYETYPIATRTFKGKGGSPRPFKPMKPFGGDIIQSKGGAGSYGKAKAITNLITETKPITKSTVKSDLFRTEKSTPRRINRMRSALEQISSEETTYLQYPKGIIIPGIKTEGIQSTAEKQIISQRGGLGNKFDNLFKTKITTKEKQRTNNIPKITTITTTKQTPVTTSITSEIVTQKQSQKQIVLPKYTFKDPLNTRTPPPGKKRIPDGGFPFGFGSEQGPGGPVGGGGATKAFVGNVPEFQFTGMFNRIETKYGKGGSIPRGYKVTKTPASNSFTAFSRASGQGRNNKKQTNEPNSFTFGKISNQGKKSTSKQPKSLSNKFNRLI